MNVAEFEAALRRDGFTDIEARELPAHHQTSEHAHPFNVRALVTGGEITLTTQGVASVYRAGDVFVMAAAQPHRENVGATGVAYVVGKR